MIPILALIRKDVILFLQDKRALMLTLLMPILLAAFFGYLSGGSGNKEAAKIRIGVVQQDQHVISEKILAGLKADSSLQVIELDIARAREQVQKGKLAVALVLPAGFGEAAGSAFFNAKSKPDLPIFYDPSQSTQLAMVKGILTQHVMQSVSAEMFSGKSGATTIDQSIAQLEQKIGQENGSSGASQELKTFLLSLRKFQQAQQTQPDQIGKNASSQTSESDRPAGLSMPFQSKEEALSAKTGLATGYNGYAHSFAGMTVQFILFLAIDAGISILLSRKLGIWNRLLAAPISMNMIIVARGLSCALIALFVSCVICAVAMVAFQVQILGSGLGLVGVAICFSLMTASFGLLIAAFGKTPEAARGIAIFATLIMVMLGGAWMPSFLFPQWLQDLTIFIPTRWAVDGFDAMTWRGLDISAAISSMAALLGFTCLFSALALWRFSRERMQK